MVKSLEAAQLEPRALSEAESQALDRTRDPRSRVGGRGRGGEGLGVGEDFGSVREGGGVPFHDKISITATNKN